MKKIINGKVYNTDTAIKIAEYESGSVTDGLHYYTETLYRKKTGEYFIHGEGGAATIYGEQTSYDRRLGGERIYPISFDKATEWAEKHMDADAYIKEFGIVDDDSKIVYAFNLTQTSLDKLRKTAQRQETSMSALIEGWIQSL